MASYRTTSRAPPSIAGDPVWEVGAAGRSVAMDAHAETRAEPALDLASLHALHGTFETSSGRHSTSRSTQSGTREAAEEVALAVVHCKGGGRAGSRSCFTAALVSVGRSFLADGVLPRLYCWPRSSASPIQTTANGSISRCAAAERTPTRSRPSLPVGPVYRHSSEGSSFRRLASSGRGESPARVEPWAKLLLPSQRGARPLAMSPRDQCVAIAIENSHRIPDLDVVPHWRELRRGKRSGGRWG